MVRAQATLAASLLLAHGALGADWLQYENAYFRIYTDASERRTRPMVEDLDRFRQAVLVVTNWKIPPGGKPVEVFILKTGFRELVGVRGVGGVATPLDDAPGPDGTTALVMPAQGRVDVDEREVLRHEYVHALSRYRGVKFPRWYEEGIAEVFAYTRVDGASIVVDVPAERIRTANRAAGFGFDLMASSYDDVVNFGQGERRSTPMFADYYLQAWLLAHYLTFGNPALAPKVEKCILYNELGMQPSEAFKLAFGMTPAEMHQRELRHYISQLSGRRFELRRPITATPFTVTTAPAGVVEAKLEAIRQRWAKPKDVPEN